MFPKGTWDLFNKEAGDREGWVKFADANGVPWLELDGYMADDSHFAAEPALSLEDLSASAGEDDDAGLDVRWDVNDKPNDRYTILPSRELAEKVLLVTGVLQARESGE